MKTHKLFFGKRVSMAFDACLAAVLLAVCSVGAMAQNSLPAPGAGGSFRPNIGHPMAPPNGIGWNPGSSFQGNWGSPWNSGWNRGPTIVVNQSPVIPEQGVTRVVACGYDAQGIWRVLPLTVSYQYNGVQYVVNVLNAWNPWTDM